MEETGRMQLLFFALDLKADPFLLASYLKTSFHFGQVGFLRYSKPHCLLDPDLSGIENRKGSRTNHEVINYLRI